MDNEGKTITSANDDIKAEDTKSRKPFIKRVAEAVKKFVTELFSDETWKCELCSKELFGNGYICKECEEKLPYLKDAKRCNHCGRKTDYAEDYCTACKNILTETDLGRSVFNYEGKIILLITNFKFRRKAYLKKFFAEELYKVYKEENLTADVVCYIPMTEKAIKKRGYNQTELLAEEFSSLSGIPVADALKKTRDTHKQIGLKRKERLENLKGSFKVTDKEAVKGKTVLLIDDVTTTGATGEVVASYLKKAGAVKVVLLTVASVGSDKETELRRKEAESKFKPRKKEK